MSINECYSLDNYVIVSCGSTIAYIFDSFGDSCMFRVDFYVQFYMIYQTFPSYVHVYLHET